MKKILVLLMMLVILSFALVSCGDYTIIIEKKTTATAPTEPVHIHTEVIQQAVEPTCYSTGITEGRYCLDCGEILVEQVEIPVIEHKEVVDEAIEATCNATGLTEGSHCEYCGLVLIEQVEVPFTYHTEVIDEGISSTCTTLGLSEGKHCSVCNVVLVEQQELPLAAHTYDDYYDRECNVCGYILEIALPNFIFHYGTTGSASAGTPHVTQPTETVAGTVVTAGTDKYIMPNVSAVQDGKIGSTTVNGVTIYYPIVDGINVRSGVSTDYDFLRYYPIFKGVTITDDTRSFGYESTKEMPTYFTWVSATISGNSNGSLATDPMYKLYDNKYLTRYQTTKGDIESGDNSLVKFSYQAVDGNTYYYYIGYKFYDEDEGGACVTGDTLVTLANGTQKEIQYVTNEDMLLVWNFEAGKYDVAPASIVMNHGYSNYTVTSLTFSDGTTVNTINGHGFYDLDSNKFVIIDENNVAEYIGHNFVKQDGDTYTTVTLVDYTVKEEYTESWSILTAVYHNAILEGMLTLTPAEVAGSPEYLMPFAVVDMKYDEAMMHADIEQYGLYTYEDFADYITYEEFTALNLKYFKVAVGKGYITFDEIIYLISLHCGK